MNKSRSKAVKLNFVTGFIQELIVVVFGLIVPRIILGYFGSAYNGLLNSVTHFMSFSVVLRSGLGVVTNAALYKPLADGDVDRVSGIMSATDKFMRKVGLLLGSIIVVFSLVYPLLVLDEFEYLFSATLILIIGAASWVENMFSIKYKILLQADQKYYVQTIVMIIAYVLSNVFAILLAVAGFGIHVVRFGMLIGLMTTPFMLKIYVQRHYKIDWKHAPDDVAIKSRWDAFAQQIATVANNNVSTIVMTFVFPMTEISVYTVYHMVIKNINQLLTTSFAGIRSTFGNMYAKGEYDTLKNRFMDVEWMIFSGGAVFYSIAGIMLTPFVLIYTNGVNDADYNRYWFGMLITLACYVYITRLPYQMMAEAVGKFKETRNSSIMEIVVNIAVSFATAPFIGLYGIVLGMLIGGICRMINLIWVCNRDILKMPLLSTIKNYIVYIGTSTVLTLLISKLIDDRCTTVASWIIGAALSAVAVSVVVLAVSAIFNLAQLKGVTKYIRKK